MYIQFSVHTQNEQTVPVEANAQHKYVITNRIYVIQLYYMNQSDIIATCNT